MSVLEARRELLADKEKFNSFMREIARMLMLSLLSVNEKHPILQFGQVFADCEVIVTVHLAEEGEDYEPSHGHPTIKKA